MSAGPAARIIGDWTVPLAASARYFLEVRLDKALPRFASQRSGTCCKEEVSEGLCRRREARVMRMNRGGRGPFALSSAFRSSFSSSRWCCRHLLTTIPMSDGKPLVPPLLLLHAGRCRSGGSSNGLPKARSGGTLWITLSEAALAFVIGSVGGVLVGFWFARQPIIAAIFDPYVEDGQRAAAHRAGADLHAVVRPRHLVEGGARCHAGVLHRVLQRLSGRA